MQDFRRLRVAQSARTVIRATYYFTRSLPEDERHGLSSQMRRAALSIGLNIVEGCGRWTTKDFIRFLDMARSSGTELEFAFIVAEDLEFGDDERRVAATKDLLIVQRELSALISALRKRLAARTRL